MKCKCFAEATMILALLVLTSIGLQAQVTIGSSEKPLDGALLDLKETGTTKKGLSLPRTELSDLNKLKMGTVEILDTDDGGSQYQKHVGLLVYNTAKVETKTNRICPGIHIWDGRQWQAIASYAEPLIKKTLLSVGNRNFEYLDPNSPIG